jgi:hypothetical protein
MDTRLSVRFHTRERLAVSGRFVPVLLAMPMPVAVIMVMGVPIRAGVGVLRLVSMHADMVDLQPGLKVKRRRGK